MEQVRVALVTGANRGIGKEVCRQLLGKGFMVLLGCRDGDKGGAAASSLHGTLAVAVGLDVNDDAGVADAVSFVTEQIGRLDVLVNNAAVMYDDWAQAIDVDLTDVRAAIETNLLGAWRVTQRFLPLLRKSGGAGCGEGDLGGAAPGRRAVRRLLPRRQAIAVVT
jgi:NAD(P)-dependent dehydrogenase (short-subunit alcohol dehydrogenase family)